MIQKWGKEGFFPFGGSKGRATFGGLRYLIFIVGFIVAGSQFARSQWYYGGSGDSTFLRGLTYVAPLNDNFISSILLSNYTATGYHQGPAATAEPGEPAHEGRAATNSTWWRWTAPQSGFVKMTAEVWSGYSEDLKHPVHMGIYTGCELTNLTPVQLLPGSSPDIGTDLPGWKAYVFEAVSGETYQIALDCAVDARITLSFENLLIYLPGGSTSRPFTQPLTFEYGPYDSNAPIVWMAAFAGTNLLGIATNPPFEFSYSTPIPTNVTFSAVGTNSLGNPLISFPLTVAFSPLNNDFTQAVAITDASPEDVFAEATDAATAEPGEPDLGLGIAALHTVWWKWTPTYLVPTIVTLRSPSSAMAIFKGTDLSNLQRIATLHNGGNFPWSPGPANTTFFPEPGITYYFVGESESYVQWSYDQQTLQLTPATPQHIYIGDPIEFDAAWYESNDPPVTVSFVIGGYYNGGLFGSGYYPIALAGAAASEPYKTSWIPTNGGKFFAWALCTNNLGMLRYSAVTELNIYASNDDFSHATVIPSDTSATSFTFSPSWSTSEVGELPHRHGPAVGTWWWQWTPSYSGSVRLKATRGTYAVTLEIFSGNSLTNLHRIADNLGKDHRMGIVGSVRVPVRAGQTYYIRVDDTRPNFYIPFLPDTNITVSLEPASLGPRAELDLGFSRNFAHSQRPFARLFMPDGRTPVIGNNFHAQLYVGSTATTLSPIGGVTTFIDSPYPSYWAGTPWSLPVILPSIKAHTRVFAQVRVWDSHAGANYDAAQAAGGLVGESKVVRVITGSEDTGPAPLNGISNFKLHGPN
jgi:hypothetical protein